MTATIVPLDGTSPASEAGASALASPAPVRAGLAAMLLGAESRYAHVGELFAMFLDETMTGTSGRFDPALARGEQSLEAAQVRKVDGALSGQSVLPSQPTARAAPPFSAGARLAGS